ncbi:MAG: outer membrane protein assembly factor BamE [Planctomycetes bacterium]|nr:outer membrane protein assembly factor BamE [Planctomycetota bacterium]
MAKAKTCQYCHTENVEIAGFCKQCGRPFGVSAQSRLGFVSRRKREWRHLEKGMRETEVLELLGTPEEIAKPEHQTIWKYGTKHRYGEIWKYEVGHVSFDTDGRVSDWKKPGQDSE